jgi:uncharacterized membrane protein
MKNCPRCHAPLEDDAAFCGNCGANLAEFGSTTPEEPEAPQAPNPEYGGFGGSTQGYEENPGFGGQPGGGYQQDYGNQGGYQQGYGAQGGYGYAPPPPAPTDHTAEYDPKDISQNKVLAMTAYLLGAIGVIIALLGSHDSPYVAFHVRQALKLAVVEVLVIIISVVLCWSIIVPIAGTICLVILVVLRIIAFFQVCSGKAKEPAIISSLGFMK